MPFLSLSDKDSKLSRKMERKNVVKNGGSVVGNAIYLQSPNYKNIKGLCSF